MMKLYKNEAGFTLVEIMIVVLIIGVIAALAIPNLLSAQQTAWAKTCEGNRATILASAELYRIQKGQGPTSLNDLLNKVDDYPPVLSKTPTCPAKGNYTVNTVDQVINVYCSEHEPVGESEGDEA